MKTIVKLSFLAFLLLVGTQSASAFSGSSEEEGLSFGVRAAVAFTDFSGSASEGMDGVTGYGVGLFVEYTLPNNLYLLTGLDLIRKGAKGTETDDDEVYKLEANPLYLQIPLHAGYKVGLTEDLTLGVHAGPYVAYGISGKWKYKETYNGQTEEEKWDFFGDEEEGGCKKFDMGLGIGADLNYQNFRFGLSYDWGLKNISRWDEKLKNRSFMVSVGYTF